MSHETDWFEKRKDVCNAACAFHGCFLQRLEGKCRLKRLALPMFCCPHELFLPVLISEIKVAKKTVDNRLRACSVCNYNASGFCQALRSCSMAPIQSDDTDISKIVLFEEALPFRGCKHPRRNVKHRPPYGWTK